jgi:hypothetical protein
VNDVIDVLVESSKVNLLSKNPNNGGEICKPDIDGNGCEHENVDSSISDTIGGKDSKNKVINCKTNPKYKPSK